MVSRRQHAMFSPREMQLIKLFIEDRLTSEEAAGVLGLSPKTTATHRSNIMYKLRALLKQPHLDCVDLALFCMAAELVDTQKVWKRYQSVSYNGA